MSRSGQVLYGAAIVGVLLVLSGATASVITQRSVKPEFDPGVLIQAGVTCLVGFFLTQHLGLRLSQRRYEQELVAKHVERVLDRLEEVSALLTGPEPTQAALTSPLKRVGSDLVLLDPLLRRVGFGNRESFQKECVEILKRLRVAATDKVRPLPEDLVRAEKAYRDLRERIALLVFDIHEE